MSPHNNHTNVHHHSVSNAGWGEIRQDMLNANSDPEVPMPMEQWVLDHPGRYPSLERWMNAQSYPSRKLVTGSLRGPRVYRDSVDGGIVRRRWSGRI
jgi:hypothetical protein